MNTPLHSSEIKAAERARQDCLDYASAVQRGDLSARTVIEEKYGLYGLLPQQVSESLNHIAYPALRAGRAS